MEFVHDHSLKSDHWVSVTILGAEDATVNNIDRNPYFHGTSILEGYTDNTQVSKWSGY